MSVTTAPIDHPGIWHGDELFQRDDWLHKFSDQEIDELDHTLRLTEHLGIKEINKDSFPLPLLGQGLSLIQESLENGSGAVMLRGFPTERYSEKQTQRLFWAMACNIGMPVSQSAERERIFSVRDSGYKAGDPRLRGPNSSNRLSFHSDRCDVIGFHCLRQAKSGGENEIVHSIALHNTIQKHRPDLLAILYQPFYFKRHTVDMGNQEPWCQQPIFSIQEGHFACNLLRVLIERAYALPELPDLTPHQQEALDFIEDTASNPKLHVRFRQERGDILFLNNFVTLHRRSAYEDHEDPSLRRHLLRIWLSVPNSRPLHPLFKDNYGDTRAGAVRGGMNPVQSGLDTNKSFSM